MPATFLTGINYPWTRFQGRSNYGCDFGVNVWGGHWGVSTHVDEISRDFEAMAAMGLEVTRWFLFTDGRGGIRWNSAGQPSGLADGFLDDMDAALETARANSLRLCVVLFDYLWMNGTVLENAAYAPDPELLATADGRARLLEAVLDPFIDRYGTSGSHAHLGAAIHSIDVINEPDWVTTGLERQSRWWRFKPRGARPFSLSELRTLVADVARRVHRATDMLVTVGGARVRHVREWDDPSYELDFVQVHSYPDVRRPHRDRSLIGVPSRELGVSKPVLIGEFPANGDRQHPADHQPPPFSADDYLNLARNGGYLGAWPWSFKGHDAFGGFGNS